MREISERISRILENDEFGTAKRTLRIVQSDVAALLCEFMEVKKLDLSVDKNDDGYVLKITVDASRIYNVGQTSEIAEN